MAGKVMLALVLAIAAVGPAWAGEWPRARTETRDTRTGTHPNLTRLVLDVSELSRFQTHVADEGRRILVGIPSVDWEANRHRLKPHGIIARYDFMRRGLKRGLLVVYTHAPARIEYQFTLPPDPADHKGNRLVLDLVPRDHVGRVAMPKRVEPKKADKPKPKPKPADKPKPKPVTTTKASAPAPAPAASASVAPVPAAKPVAAPEPTYFPTSIPVQ